MSVQERQAWYAVVVLLLVGVAYVAMLLSPATRPNASIVFCLIGLLGALPWIGRAERRSGRVEMDERDYQINRTATSAAYVALIVLIAAAVIIPSRVMASDASVRLSVVNEILILATMLVFFIRSLAVIVLYRRASRA